MDPFQQRLAGQVKALSQVCETLLIRILEAEERLVKLTIMVNNDVVRVISNSSFQTEDVVFYAADSIVDNSSSHLDFNEFETVEPENALNNSDIGDRRPSLPKTIELSFDSTEFIDDENQELRIDYEEVQDDYKDFHAASN